MKKIPITIVTGFLGVGMTTLVHNMLINANITPNHKTIPNPKTSLFKNLQKPN